MKEKGNRRCDLPRYTQQPEAKVVAHKVTSGRANSEQLKRDAQAKITLSETALPRACKMVGGGGGAEGGWLRDEDGEKRGDSQSPVSPDCQRGWT